MNIEQKNQKNNQDGEELPNVWKDFLYFGFKKAKHFVRNETSFVNDIEIVEFEENLDDEIAKLSQLLQTPEELKKVIETSNVDEKAEDKNHSVTTTTENDSVGDKMVGYLYFTPKSPKENGETRIRPKVYFPLRYQVLWSAVILRIGEWFDTNHKLKNVFSMRDEMVRKQFDWMVPWSFNGRIKRLQSKTKFGTYNETYIQYNNQRLYNSHQFALRNFAAYEKQAIEELYKSSDEVYRAELDIEEFFPTLKKDKIKEMFNDRLQELSEIDGFTQDYFSIEGMKEIITNLLKLKIIYPDTIDKKDPFYEVINEYKHLLLEGKEERNEQDKDSDNLLEKLLSELNQTLPLDLVASNFLSNCTLNHFVDRKLTKKKHTKVLRYTDDYSVIATTKEDVIATVKDIKEKLDEIGLNCSRHKTLPTTPAEIIELINDIESPLEFTTLSDKLTQEKSTYGLDAEDIKFLKHFNIHVEPDLIKKDELGKDLLINRVSSSSDMNIRALTDNELEIYINELMTYIKSKGDVGELKEETAKIFSSWRLQSTYRELLYRKSYTLHNLKPFMNILKDFINKYPHKLGYVDIYLLLLFEITEDDDAFTELESFLRDISVKMKNVPYNDEQARNRMCYLAAIRIRVLKTFTRNWKKFDGNTREKFRTVLNSVFLTWYAFPKVSWDELYVMNISFFIMRIKLPINKSKGYENLPPFVKQAIDVYNKFLMREKGQNTSIDQSSLKLTIYLMKEGIYKDLRERNYQFSSADFTLYEELKQEITKETSFHNKLAFARLAPYKLDSKDWDILTTATESNESTDDQSFKLYDFIQSIIKLYFQRPSTYKNILRWCEQNKENKENKYLKYTKNRFHNYSLIRQYYSLKDVEKVDLSLIENNREKVCCNDSLSIPIADWVFYCQTLPRHLDSDESKQKVLHPLTEYEIVKILFIMSNKLMEEAPEKIEIYSNEHTENELQNKLFSMCMTPANWEIFRKEDLELTSYGDTADEETKKVVEQLFKLMTNNPWHFHVREHYSLYKWNDLQSYFRMTYYPSSSIANLFVNYLNIHQDFYSEIYQIPSEELPYRIGDKKPTNIVLWMKNYLQNNRLKMILTTENRKIELLEINLDQLGDT